MQLSEVGSVCGSKFEDNNGNGVQDPDELGLGGWTIQVTDAAGRVVATVVTDKNGTFCFKDLHLSVYTVSEVMQPGWQQTLPGTGSYNVQLTRAQPEGKPLLFGTMQSSEVGSVCGTKFEDTNGNGVQDRGEVGLGGWTVQIMDDKGNMVATVVTRDDGTFCFERLRPGVYTFAEVMHGQNAESVDFGNQKKPDPCCLSFRFLQGRADNFATADGAESAQPSLSAARSP